MSSLFERTHLSQLLPYSLSARPSPNPLPRERAMLILQVLKNRCSSLPASDTHCHHAVTRLAPPHLAKQLHGEFGSRRAERMAERHRAAVDVRSFGVHSQLAHDRDSLAGKRFVEFDQIDLVEF